MSENGNALQELRWHRICTSSSTIEMSQVECAENCRDSTAEIQMQKIQKMLHSTVQNMLMPDPNRHKAFSNSRNCKRNAERRSLEASNEARTEFRDVGTPTCNAREKRQNKTRSRSLPQCE